MKNIIQYRKYAYIVSIVLTVVSILAIGFWGLKLGIDFKGGTLLSLQYPESAPTREAVYEKLDPLQLSGLSVQPAENNTVNIRYTAHDDTTNQEVLKALGEEEQAFEVLRADFIGGAVSQEITHDAFIGVVLSLIAIAVFIAYAFRKVSGVVTSWDYGWGAIIALAHDIVITVGIFAFLGHYYNIEIGVPFIAALLTILGYSVNDTIVVYDRVRENLMRGGGKVDFEALVNKSLNETLGRSVSTSVTVIITLLAITLYGGESTFSFALALLIGVTFGTYSSIFIASALLVSRYHWKMARKNK
jgi:preprotein translocase SecF subunit